MHPSRYTSCSQQYVTKPKVWCRSLSTTLAAPSTTFKIRPCRQTDVKHIADICTEVFVHEKFQEQLAGTDTEGLKDLIDGYTNRVHKEVSSKLEQALMKKQQAAAASRTCKQQIHERKGNLSSRQLQEYSKQTEDLDTQRMAVCFVVEERSTGELVACANLTMMQPEAVLPPPLPSSAPLRAYISNMAVLPRARRQGLASALLQACERLGRRWQQDSLWLHVNSCNSGAQLLYSRLGYRLAPGPGGYMGMLPGSLKEYLLTKPLKTMSS